MVPAELIYFSRFADLHVSDAVSLDCRTWMRGRTWASGALKYVRPPAASVSVTWPQHEKLKREVEGACATWRGILASVESRWDAEFIIDRELAEANAKLDKWAKLSAPSPYAWPEGFSDRAWENLKEMLRAEGAPEDSMTWETVSHAAAKALSVYEKQVRSGVRPHTYLSETRNAGVTVRLGAGTRFGRPVERDGSTLRLHGLGDVCLSDEGIAALKDVDVTKATYAEMAHCIQTWRVQFVVAEEREPRAEGAPRRERVKKEKAGAGTGTVASATPSVDNRKPWEKTAQELGRPFLIQDVAKTGSSMPPLSADEQRQYEKYRATFG